MRAVDVLRCERFWFCAIGTRVRALSEKVSGEVLVAGSITSRRLAPIVAGALVLVTATFTACSGPAVAQGIVDPELNLQIESVDISIANPSPDPRVNARIEDFVRRTLGAYPSDRYSPEGFGFSLARTKRSAEIAEATHSIEFGQTGGVIVNVVITLGAGAAEAKPRGMLTEGGAKDFPVLYDANGTFLKLKLESLAMYYGNNDAWYGRPDLTLAGNPLVKGKTAGPGYHDWTEGFFHTGLYGITPLSDSVYVYGGLSAIVSGSVGQELFTDETRSYLGLEDAYVGIVGGTTTEKGDRLVVNASAGRQRFSIGEGFLIVNSAANGGDRAALQSNPRWASDMLAIGQVKYNNTKLEAFYFDPDELPLIDSDTKIVGANLETRIGNQLDLGATVLYVPESTFGYFTTTGSFSREGLQVFDARLRWQPNPGGVSGPFIAAEGAFQRNENFDMAAYGFFGEVGYSFADVPWTPTISYRYAQFSGDDPDTSRFERWDPLYSGGTGEQWVQGINHFKLFQDSNLIAHRIQARVRPSPKVELVPQLWFFQAESTTNIGGNPALSVLGSKDLGFEVNMTAKYFMSRNVLIQGSVAATFAGDAIDTALGAYDDPWISAMMFVRIGF